MDLDTLLNQNNQVKTFEQITLEAIVSHLNSMKGNIFSEFETLKRLIWNNDWGLTPPQVMDYLGKTGVQLFLLSNATVEYQNALAQILTSVPTADRVVPEDWNWEFLDVNGNQTMNPMVAEKVRVWKTETSSSSSSSAE